jgi:hypothetical protein
MIVHKNILISHFLIVYDFYKLYIKMAKIINYLDSYNGFK